MIDTGLLAATLALLGVSGGGAWELIHYYRRETAYARSLKRRNRNDDE